MIAYSIAHRLLSDDKRDTAASLTVEEIQREALEWWNEGFHATESFTEQSFRVLLEEMIGLGVVRKNGEGQYTLRSVNIFSILGRQKEIESVLKSKHKIPPQYEAATFRSAYPTKSSDQPAHWRRSPLTAQQISELQSIKNGVSITFGSRASGLDDLEDFLALAFGNRTFMQIREAPDQQSFVDQLKAMLNKRESHGVTLINVPPTCPWDHQWVREALKQVQALTSKNSWARVTFIADPAKSWEVISDHANELFSLVTSGLTPFSLTPWHDAAVGQWLEDCSFPVQDEQREWIKEVSGNWPIILQELPKLEMQLSRWDASFEKFVNLAEDAAYAEKLCGDFGLEIQEPCEVLKALAAYEDPITTEELISLTGKPDRIVESDVTWAKHLMLITPGDKWAWNMDPVVSRILRPKQHAESGLGVKG